MTRVPFDSAKYEREQNAEQRKAEEALRAHPGFTAALDEFGRGPAVTLTCAKRHRLLAIYAYVHDRITLAPVGEHVARKSGSVSRRAEPWRRDSTVCQQSGCPTIIDYEGTCEVHGGKRNEVIGGIRTEFTCRQCKRPAGVVTTASLLKWYGLAVITGQSSVPISQPGA